MRRLLAIVEGQGDAKAIPLLIRNILKARHIYDIKLLPPQRRGEYPVVAKNFDRLFEIAVRLEKAPILWVMDFDAEGCNCPYEAAQALLDRAAELRPGWPIEIAFLVKEYEVLFLHDENATRHVFPDLAKDKPFPSSPEKIRDAKGWISERLPSDKAYSATAHQEKITAQLNLDLLRQKSKDFAHLERAILKLIDAEIPQSGIAA
jgi:hypothetical protein